MKGYRIFIGMFVAILLAGGIFVVYILNYKMDNNNFGNDLIPYTDAGNDLSSKVTAEYKGEKYKVEPYAVVTLHEALTRGSFDRKKLILKKEYDIDNIVLHFKGTADITIMKVPKKVVDDGVIIKYKKHDKNRAKYYSVDGYATFDHILETFYNVGDKDIND